MLPLLLEIMTMVFGICAHNLLNPSDEYLFFDALYNLCSDLMVDPNFDDINL